MSVALSVYHRLPASSRSIVASARGYYLSWWRYDKETEKRVEEALERDLWTAKQWDEWRQERLAFILHRAATRVPYYREAWSKRRRDGDKSSFEYLENWPILEKQTLRERGIKFVADDRNPKKMFRDHTSGTTGTSLDIWMTRQTVKEWYALFEARWRRWYGVSKKDRWAIIGGQLVVPAVQKKPPFWVWNSAFNQLYMSAYHLSPDLMQYYLRAIVKYRIKYVLGYTSAIYSIAREVLRQPHLRVELQVAITNAEPLYDFQRETILHAFGCPVRETYGMAELVAAASECNEGNLHQWPEVGMIDADKDGPLESDFFCTGLINGDMPLIRYRVGDRGKLSTRQCGCKRTLPLFETIEGRSDDVLYTKDGRQIGRLDPIFKGDLGIVEAQIVQRSLDAIVIRYVPTTEFNEKSTSKLKKRIRERMGDVEVQLERVKEIGRTDNGKFRAVVSEIPYAERPLG